MPSTTPILEALVRWESKDVGRAVDASWATKAPLVSFCIILQLSVVICFVACVSDCMKQNALHLISLLQLTIYSTDFLVF